MIHGSFVADLLISYVALLSIINPFGVAFVFLNMTQYVSEAERTAIARRIGMYSFAVLVTSLLIGAEVMRFFGVTLPALRIAGGIVVALSGWAMLNAPADPAPPPADPNLGHPATVDDRVFFPLTVPLTTGPGAIATAIALGATRPGDWGHVFSSITASLLVSVLVAATIVVAYSYASTAARWVGHEGTRVITRLTAFLLMCIGVQIILTGIADALPALIAQGHQPPAP